MTIQKEKLILDVILAYLKMKRNDLDYHIERVIGDSDIDAVGEFKDLNWMIKSLRKMK